MDAAEDEDDTTQTSSLPTTSISSSSASSSSSNDETVSLSRVSAVANGWMFDFTFLSVCRCFRERNLDDFNASLNTLEAIVVNRSSPLGADQAHKKNIAAFLTRIMHGKDLTVKFEEDDHVLPLMSAVNIWERLRKTVTEDGLFENISTLLLVQAVAVCLEKGQPSQARSVLKWLTERHDIARNVSAKLSLVSCRADIYHPFLLNFSFDRLLESVQGYLDAYLEKKPSDFLFKAATRMIQSKVVKEDSMASDDSSSESTRKSMEDFKSTNPGQTTFLRRKKKLLLPKNGEMLMCQPDSHKTPAIRLNSVPKDTASRLTCQGVCPESPDKSQNNSELGKPRKKRVKWNKSMDALLKKGVERHGVGKWTLILQDYDFSGRTSVMLKDRWRVLKKSYIV